MCQSAISEVDKILLTAFFGIVVFVAGQVISKFLIEPIYERRKVIGSIADALIFYAPLIAHPGDPDSEIDKISALNERIETENTLRQLSCSLMAKTCAIPWYKKLSFQTILDSYRHLLFLSNSVVKGHASENQERVLQIKKLLRIEF